MTQGVIHSDQEVSHMAETKTRRRGYFRTLEKRLEEAGGEVMKAWRAQARRDDRVGDLTYHGLQMLHGGAKFAARSLSRLEEATQPPHRMAPREPRPAAHEPAHPARRAPAATPAARPRPAPRAQKPGVSAS
jgi:hypothetical protein